MQQLFQMERSTRGSKESPPFSRTKRTASRTRTAFVSSYPAIIMAPAPCAMWSRSRYSDTDQLGGPLQEIVENRQCHHRLAAIDNRIEKHPARLGIVIFHALRHGALPDRFTRPFGRTDERAVRIPAQARAITFVLLRDRTRAAPPGFAELLIHSGLHMPLVEDEKHFPVLSYG